MKTKTPETDMTPAQEKRLEAIRRDAMSVAGLFERAYKRMVSPRQAIKAQCLDCCGLDKIAIHECGDRCCPLWHFRPYTKHPEPDSPETAPENSSTGAVLAV